MKKSSVTVIDYGIGNLFSVMKAFEYCGAEVTLATAPEQIACAERLVLPGVGAFADGMTGLKERGLISSIHDFAANGRPFMGICLGMQMMLDTSEEFGLHQGLGLISGKVVAIPNEGAGGQAHKIPHIGWNRLVKPDGDAEWDNTILGGISPDATAYFLHSFTAVPTDSHHRLADCDYHGRTLSAVIRSGNLYGCQFHPEKSGPVGLHMLKNFLVLPCA